MALFRSSALQLAPCSTAHQGARAAPPCGAGACTNYRHGQGRASAQVSGLLSSTWYESYITEVVTSVHGASVPPTRHPIHVRAFPPLQTKKGLRGLGFRLRGLGFRLRGLGFRLRRAFFMKAFFSQHVMKVCCRSVARLANRVAASSPLGVVSHSISPLYRNTSVCTEVMKFESVGALTPHRVCVHTVERQQQRQQQ